MRAAYLLGVLVLLVVVTDAKAWEVSCSVQGQEMTVAVSEYPALGTITVVHMSDGSFRGKPNGKATIFGEYYKLSYSSGQGKTDIGYVHHGLGAYTGTWEFSCEICNKHYYPDRLPPWARGNSRGYWQFDDPCGAVKSLLTHYITDHLEGGS